VYLSFFSGCTVATLSRIIVLKLIVDRISEGTDN